MAVAVAVPVPEEVKTAVVNPGDNNGGGDGGGGGGDLRKDIQVVHGARCSTLRSGQLQKTKGAGSSSRTRHDIATFGCAPCCEGDRQAQPHSSGSSRACRRVGDHGPRICDSRLYAAAGCSHLADVGDAAGDLHASSGRKLVHGTWPPLPIPRDFNSPSLRQSCGAPWRLPPRGKASITCSTPRINPGSIGSTPTARESESPSSRYPGGDLPTLGRFGPAP